MKAVDWVPQFQADLATALSGFVNETIDLILERGATNPLAIERTFKEQKAKFAAIHRQLLKNLPAKDGDAEIVKDHWDYLFDDMMEHHIQLAYGIYLKVTNQYAKRRAHRHASLIYRKERDQARAEKDPEIRLGLTLAAILNRQDAHREIDEMYGE